MRGIICYYSGSGNTKLACRYLARHLEAIDFDFLDITQQEAPDFEPYDLVGFATFADFYGPPQLFQNFLEALPQQAGKPAFVLNTYGFIGGRTLQTLAEWTSTRGFNILAGHALHTPESFPLLNALGVGKQAPSQRSCAEFDRFIEQLAGLLQQIQSGSTVQTQEIHLSFLNSLFPRIPRTAPQTLMGKKYVDETRCTACGLCASVCPCDAIRLTPKPVFDESRCHGCWACYNHCPEQAIHTKIIRGIGHYPRPSAQMRKKLSK